jgi:non-specific serine/threonine protein kinase
MQHKTNRDGETQDAPRTGIPTVLTTFIGRKRELAAVTAALASSRLVTLTGAPGCGKTRLALRVAAELSREFEKGAHWVDLARLTDPGLVPQVVAKAVNVVEQPGRSLVDELLDALRDQQLLLVLDNCEHLLSACAQLVENLMPVPGISIMTTSREPLGVTGEIRYPVSPMPAPPLSLAAHDLGHFDAIQLFVERARAVLPEFALTPDNAEVVASICRNLDGIPLAIELASARVNVLTVEQVSARLEHRFELLASAAHVTRSHHRTLRAAIDWSYESLAPPEQALLARLSVFAAGCSLAAAEAVCAVEGIEQAHVLDLLTSLVDKSLVMAHTLRRSEARYSLLETIRQYAQERLTASGDLSAIRDRHLQCFLRLVEETEPKLSGQYQPLWLNWLESEHDDIRAALSWSLESDRIEAGLRIVIAIYQFWTIRNRVVEGLAWMERLLARVDERVSPVVRTNALAYSAFLAGFQGRISAQMQYGRNAAVLAEAAGDAGNSALRWALAAQAYGARAAGDHESEFSLGKRVIQLNRELGDAYQLGVTLSVYSLPAMALGQYDAARRMLAEALALLREAGNPYRIATALNFSGDLARCEQDYVQAHAAYEESISLLRELDAPRDLASALQNLGCACLHLGNTERARALLAESMEVQQAQRNTPGMSECLIGFAGLAVASESPDAGARLLAAAVSIGGQRIASAWPATRMEYERYLALVHASLTEPEFQAEQAAGHAFSLQQAVRYAQDLLLRSAAPPAVQDKPDELTRREREVAALIARGRSNGEIADELVVSKRTVEKHIANILAKLGFANQARIVRWSIEAGLVRSSG